jgi:hypothetical protein
LATAVNYCTYFNLSIFCNCLIRKVSLPYVSTLAWQEEILPPAFTTVLPACPTCLRPPPPPALGRDGLRPDWVGPPAIHLPQVFPLPIFSAATTQLPSPSAGIPLPVTFSPACMVVPPPSPSLPSQAGGPLSPMVRYPNLQGVSTWFFPLLQEDSQTSINYLTSVGQLMLVAANCCRDEGW